MIKIFLWTAQACLASCHCECLCVICVCVVCLCACTSLLIYFLQFPPPHPEWDSRWAEACERCLCWFWTKWLRRREVVSHHNLSLCHPRALQPLWPQLLILPRWYEQIQLDVLFVIHWLYFSWSLCKISHT